MADRPGGPVVGSRAAAVLGAGLLCLASVAASVSPAQAVVSRSPQGDLSAGVLAAGQASAARAVAPLARVRVTATRVVSGLESPVLVRSAADGTSRLFVVEQAGRIRVVTKGRITGTYLDIRAAISSGGERGLLGLAFAPDFARSRYLWVSYTRGDGALVVMRYRAASATAGSISLSTGRTVLVVPHPSYGNHNGGDIGFGPDGYLYLGTGDGGGGGDPFANGQNLRSLSGKMLRIDVRCTGRAYCIPATNPYATSTTARREIWMSGLRNPWRWSFDVDGTQYVADVGQDKYEEVTIVAAGRARGANLGWSCREGKHAFNSSRCRSGVALVTPSIELCHPDNVPGCVATRSGESVIGGYVYRGTAYPAAVGTYVLADFITGYLWPSRGGALGTPSRLPQVTGFGVDDGKEMYAVTYSGRLYRIGFTTV
jgi:glucose/arabinose dehydrogenase